VVVAEAAAAEVAASSPRVTSRKGLLPWAFFLGLGRWRKEMVGKQELLKERRRMMEGMGVVWQGCRQHAQLGAWRF